MSTSKFPLGLLVAVVMAAGVVGLFLSPTSAQQTRIIALAQGWNLVTWTGEKQSAAEALDSVSDAVSAVYGYNNDSQTFTRYIVDRPEISTLTDFEPENAYWVLVDRYSATWWVPGPACPACPACPPAPTCPTPGQEPQCFEALQYASHLEWKIEFYCEALSGGACTYEREQLAAIEAYLNAYCR